MENKRVYSSYSYEIARESAVVDVQDPANIQYLGEFEFWSNSLLAFDQQLLLSIGPGLFVLDHTNQFEKVSESPISEPNVYYPFFAQIVTNPEQTLLFGLTGIYLERGGIAVTHLMIRAIRPPTHPAEDPLGHLKSNTGPADCLPPNYWSR